MSEIPQPGSVPVDVPAARFSLKRGLTVLGLLGGGCLVVALMLPPVGRSREAARHTQCKMNLRLIALALHNYHDEYGAFPPAYTVDADGRPLHSWRTLLLPFIDEAPLYNTINLEKPWDDPVNAHALQKPVAIYFCPSTRNDPTRTVYLANASQSGCFRPGVPRSRSEITDGESNTILIVEAPEELAVPWMSPNDADEALLLNLSADTKIQHKGGLHIALCDGAVRLLSATTPVATRRALLTIEAGEPVGDF